MMPLKVSWSGQTFALARSTDSPDKRTRRRRSKEERKTMVESFIKKYQNSNNGNFPSLNLTHKEVGGSFYTVREIVREIIQENKVLGPGCPTSRALNLENCFEEDVMGSFSIDSQMMDQEHKESYSLSSDRMVSKESYDTVESETVNSLSFHPNDCAMSHAASSDHLNKNSSSPYLALEYEKADRTNQSGKAHDTSGDHEFLSSEVQAQSLNDYSDHKVLQQVPSLNYVSDTYSSSETGMNKDYTGNKDSPVAVTTNSSAESNYVSEIKGQDILPETKILSNSVNGSSSSPYQDYSVSAAREVHPLASKSYSSDGRPAEAGDLTRSLEVVETQSISNDVNVDFVAVDKNPITKAIEPTDYLSSTPINEVSATRPISSASSPSETTQVEPHRVLQLGNTDCAAANTEITLCDSTPDIKVTPSVAVNTAECVDIASKSDGGNIPSSVSMPDNEVQKEEINPFWTAVKAFVAAVVKFWTE